MRFFSEDKEFNLSRLVHALVLMEKTPKAYRVFSCHVLIYVHTYVEPKRGCQVSGSFTFYLILLRQIYCWSWSLCWFPSIFSDLSVLVPYWSYRHLVWPYQTFTGGLECKLGSLICATNPLTHWKTFICKRCLINIFWVNKWFCIGEGSAKLLMVIRTIRA